jgi:hypothetical protein
MRVTTTYWKFIKLHTSNLNRRQTQAAIKLTATYWIQHPQLHSPLDQIVLQNF